MVILDLNLDSSTATGRLMISLLGSISEFEISLLKERQAIGIARAKKEGKYKGRGVTVGRRSAEIVELHQAGYKPSEIAKRLKIGVASVYRYRNG